MFNKNLQNIFILLMLFTQYIVYLIHLIVPILSSIQNKKINLIQLTLLGFLKSLNYISLLKLFFQISLSQFNGPISVICKTSKIALGLVSSLNSYKNHIIIFIAKLPKQKFCWSPFHFVCWNFIGNHNYWHCSLSLPGEKQKSRRRWTSEPFCFETFLSSWLEIQWVWEKVNKKTKT